MAPPLGPTIRTLLRRPSAPLLIAAEVAFSLTLIVHLVTLQRNAMKAASRDTGLAPATLFLVETDGAEAEARLRALDGVVGTARIDLPLHSPAQPPAAVRAANGRAAVAYLTAGAPSLPAVLGLRRLDAAAPTAPLVPDGEDGALVTVSLARALFDGGDAVGRAIEMPPRSRPLRIVGVVADALLTTGWATGAANGIIVSSPPRPTRRATFAVRTDERAAASFARAAAGALAASRSCTIESLSQRVTRNHANAAGTLIATFALIALLILGGTIGSATMVSLLVTARTREIGLRRALGASRGQVVGQIVFENLLTASAGVVAGLVLTAAVSLAVGMRPTDLELRVVLVGALAALGLPVVSSWIPARRAARIPMAVAGRTL